MNRPVLIRFSIALVLLVAVAGGWWWGSARVAAVRANVETLSATVQEKQILLARIIATRAELSSLTSDKIAIGAYFVSESDIVQFLNVLNATGRAVGSTVSILSVVAHKKIQHPMLGVSVKVTGSFDTVMRTIGAIENISYYVTMNSLSLSTSQNQAGDTHKVPWTASLTLSVGYASSTAAVASSTASVASTTASTVAPTTP